MSKSKKITVKIPKNKLNEMNQISDLMRQMQYTFNLYSKDLRVLQFLTLKELDSKLADDVEKGFKVYEVNLESGEYILKPTEVKEAKDREVDEALKNGTSSTSN